MIHPTHGDILKHEADALVNTVNCMGVMGRGIALQFRRAFADNYGAYRKAAKANRIHPGRMFVFERSTQEKPRWIINVPTRRHWKGKSRIEDIEAGLVDLVGLIRRAGNKNPKRCSPNNRKRCRIRDRSQYKRSSTTRGLL